MATTQTVAQRPDDPNIYLYVMGEWYCYNPQEPPLGSGAMGDVYRGFRCSNGAPIAVKRVKDAYANNKMIRERARQEASLAFRHPNLVEMIGCCEYAPESGPIFLLSNFVDGVDVDKFVKGFAGSVNRVEKICNVICSVLDALDYVHSRGVVHRDIKPSNIMIENGSNVRLMDLGIARMNGGNKFSSYGFIGTLKERGVVKDLHLENVNITGDYRTGGIVGNCYGEIYASSVTGSVKSRDTAGGIAGHTESGAYVHDCYNAATINASAQVAGGVVGWGDGGTVSNCFSYGTISGSQSWRGGISGYASNTTYTHNY